MRYVPQQWSSQLWNSHKHPSMRSAVNGDQPAVYCGQSISVNVVIGVDKKRGHTLYSLRTRAIVAGSYEVISELYSD